MVIIFTIPIEFIDVENPDNAYTILLYVFLACCGLGTCVVLEFSTGALLFPSLFTAEAFSTSNIVGPGASILSPQVAEFKRPYPLLIMVIVMANSIGFTYFITVPKNKEEAVATILEMMEVEEEKKYLKK